MLIIVIINVNDLDLDSVIQCLYLINNLQESLINLFIYYYLLLLNICNVCTDLYISLKPQLQLGDQGLLTINSKGGFVWRHVV